MKAWIVVLLALVLVLGGCESPLMDMPSQGSKKGGGAIPAAGISKRVSYVTRNDYPLPRRSSWMEDVFTGREGALLKEIIIPGTHDSATYGITPDSDVSPDGSSIYNAAKTIAANWGKTQNLDTIGQLEDGIRYLDLRILKHKGEFVIVHGLVSVTLDSVLLQLQQWVQAHPREIVVVEFCLRGDLVSDTNQQEEMNSLVTSRIGSALLSGNHSPAAVTMGDIWAAGKTIVGIVSGDYLADTYDHYWKQEDALSGSYANTTSVSYLYTNQTEKLSGRDLSKLHHTSVTLTPSTRDVVDSIFLGNLTDASIWDLVQKIRYCPGEWIPGWLSQGLKVNIVIGDYYETTSLVASCIAANMAPPPAPSSSLEAAWAPGLTWIYDDDGSGADEDLSVWSPDLSALPGFVPLGDRAVRSHTAPGDGVAVVKDSVPNALSRPLGYSLVWDDKGSGGDHDLSLWMPVAPPGYTALGYVATSSYNEKPSLDAVRCVHDSYLTAASPLWIWDDDGSGADWDCGIWQPGSGGISPRTFIARRSHTDSGESLGLYRGLKPSKVTGL